MADRVLVPLGSLGVLALDAEAFQSARAAGASFATPSRDTAAGAVPESLLTAEEIESRTSVPATWWLAEARANRVPHVRAGKYVRFAMAEVIEHLRARPADSRSAPRVQLVGGKGRG